MTKAPSFELIPRLEKGSLLLLDTNALVYLVDGTPRRKRFMEALFREARLGERSLLVSALAWTELLSKPLGRGDGEAAASWRRLLAETAGLEVAAFDVAMAEVAATVMGRTRLAIADAAMAATAILRHAGGLLTNDELFAKSMPTLRGLGILPPVFLLDELAWRFENDGPDLGN